MKNDLGLGILAIAIFTISMAALLGPVTGISPFIPSALAISLLGLYGADTAWWSSRGSNYFLGLLLQRSPEYKQRILYHEAGHFLVAHLLGLQVLGYSLDTITNSNNYPAEAGVIVQPLDISNLENTSVSYNNLLERYCTVWMSGIAAEQFIYGEASGGLVDIQQLKAATSHLPNPDLQQRWALLRARNLINSHQSAFHALVEQMQQNASVEACCAVIAKEGSAVV